MFSTNLKKIGCSFAKNIFFEKSKMATKVVDGCSKLDCCYEK